MVKQRLPTTKLLLGLLAYTGKGVIDFITFLQDLNLYRGAFISGGHEYVQEIKRLRREHTARQALYNLQHARYVTAHRLGNRLMIHLTDKGKGAMLAFRLRQAAVRPDGRYTVVVFDIPQSQNSARRQLRLLLRQGGFIKLQQSVWVSKHDVYRQLSSLVKLLKLESWVNIFLASDFLVFPRS